MTATTDQRTCPHCASPLTADVVRCPSCGGSTAVAPPASGFGALTGGHSLFDGAFKALSGATDQLSRQGRAFLNTSYTPTLAPGVAVQPTAAPIAPAPLVCQTCGGDGSKLADERIYCPDCRWLRPLSPDYALPVEAFLWRLDADAMHTLHGIGPLNAAAQAVSEHIGLPWFEAAVNGLRLGEEQLPDVFQLAIKAARIVGLTHLPEIYISGDHMWDSVTMGSNTSSFIALGSVLMNFRGDDLLYLIAREMGHARAGHALWNTVVNLLAGHQSTHAVLGDGLLSLFSIGKLIESGINAPLMTWQRHAAITADRAGLLAVGDMTVARRVTLQWTLHSFPLAARINLDAWRAQEDASDAVTQASSEFALSTTPYAARRLKLLREFSEQADFLGWRQAIEARLPKPPPAPPARPAAAAPPAPRLQAPRPQVPTVRFICMACKTPMLVPKATLDAGGSVNVRCPNPACGKVLKITPRASPTTPPTQPPGSSLP